MEYEAHSVLQPIYEIKLKWFVYNKTAHKIIAEMIIDHRDPKKYHILKS